MSTSDPTFKSYSAAQAQAYAGARGSYPDALYEAILKYHADSSKKFGLVLDVGCGPGNATRDVAIAFDQAIGTDPGKEMINTARTLGGKTRSGEAIKFEVSPAEECSTVSGLAPESVDLLTSAMAAHWFDMDLFWSEAAKVLKPGGTVALWTRSSFFCSRASFLELRNRLNVPQRPVDSKRSRSTAYPPEI